MPYEIREEVPDPESFVALRDAAGMAPRSMEAAERGLPNTLYGAIVVATETDETVGMARVVGDGGAVFHVCDMAVHPDHQRQGLGTRLMEAVMAYLAEQAPATAYINLLADVDGFYETWGFEPTAPATKGMWLPRESRPVKEDL